MTYHFSVDFRYDVHFTRDVLNVGNATLAQVISSVCAGTRPLPCIACLDDGLVRATPSLGEHLRTYLATYPSVFDLRHEPMVLPGGETAKDGWGTTQRVLQVGQTAQLCRHSAILVFGGGALLDAVGLGAALLHRGVRLLRLPTTVLSQNDSGVGVKCGINMDGSKNAVGAFAPPAAVINDARFLTTLSDRDWRAGIAEAYKVAAIRDLDFLAWLDERADSLRKRDPRAMDTLIRRCARLHCEHITAQGDPFEFGSARPLDFGHWAAHQLESMTDYALRHGEAVAIGIALDLLYASRQGFIATADAGGVIASMRRAGLPVWHSVLRESRSGVPTVLDGIEAFRQHLGGTLHITLPAPLGKRREVTVVDTDVMTECIQDLARHDGHALEDEPA